MAEHQKTSVFYSWVAEELFVLAHYDIQVLMHRRDDFVWFPTEGVCRLFDDAHLDWVLEQPGFAGSRFDEVCRELDRLGDELPEPDLGWSAERQPGPDTPWGRFSEACGRAFEILKADPVLAELVARSRADNPDSTRDPETYWAKIRASKD